MIRYFGRVDCGVMKLNTIGEIAEQIWLQIPQQFSWVKLGIHIVMPNHIHGIVELESTDDSSLHNHILPNFSAPTKGKSGGITGTNNPMLHQNLARVVRWFKGRATYEIRKAGFEFAWHSRYYDKIILDADMYDNITAYIERNPAEWGG